MVEVLEDINLERKRPSILDRDVLQAACDAMWLSPISSIPE